MPSLAKQVANAAKFESMVQRSLHNIIDKTDRNMQSFGRHVSRRTISSMQIETGAGHGTLYGSSSFLALERGRRGGKIPYGFYGILKKWIEDRGLASTPRERNSMAYHIMMKIKNEGTKMSREGVVQDIFTKAVEDEVNALSEEMLLTLASDIDYLNTELNR